ncbi:cell wall lytic activity [Paeniglutamicibacter gangotriensis]|uniref:Cell wall lytic activity n=1 Tax=Paeniglutamicibacter gangotriensis TaxID=254787 RepID=A0A5B0E280_9MICC|nr:NlpC/P60 family protein [Paeniglutamicibacter gangotriensis]KAA0973124.1 cell wall lytic activity [Paeniglutamicibacter gangotriensis]
MTTRQALGRHRATPVRTNPLESISKAVASNAGSVGRQAAVIAAASGLVLTLGVPAQGQVSPDASAVPVEGLSAERVAVKAVSVSADRAKDLNIERAAFTSKPAPAPVVIAVAKEVSQRSESTAPVTRSSSNADASAPMTRSNRNADASAPTTRSNRNADASAPTTRSNRDSTPTTSAAPKVKSDSMNTANLSGIAATAAKYEGAPYVWGGNTPSGWDCSGFVKYVYAKHGINIARGTSAIRASGQFVRTSSPKPGDLVFQNGGSHVGIYLGGGKMIGAQNPTTGTLLHDVTRNPLYGYYTLKG